MLFRSVKLEETLPEEKPVNTPSDYTTETPQTEEIVQDNAYTSDNANTGTNPSEETQSRNAGTGDSSDYPETQDAGITDYEIHSFIDRLFQVSNNANIPEILSLYANQVNYFGAGVVSQDFIAKDKKNYYRGWPVVNYELHGDILIEDPYMTDAKQVSYDLKFNVRNPKRGKISTGIARNILQLKRINSELKIIDIKQQMIERRKY